MNDQHRFYVISNTHWDREWRFPFERTRAMLTELFDNLLELFERQKDFKIFHADSHTILLEDYLAIKPHKRKLVEKYVRNGRLLVGPWYTLPDGSSVSGEALVRNLLRGRQVAESFGKCMNVGYTPNGFGQPSQYPQIYAGFGIDSILFYRGVDRKNWTQEFIWEGPDGTRALAFRFGMYARYNFFFLVYRPTVHGMKAFECLYKWDQGGLPFHVCRDLSYEPYYLLQFRPSFDKTRIVPALEELARVDSEGTTVPLIAAMMGCDSTAPDEVEGRIVAEANRQLGSQRVTHASLEDYVRDVKKIIDPRKLSHAHGEMRHTLQGGGQTYLHYDICGTRVYLRQQNNRSEVQLVHVAEPISAAAAMLGEEYPAGLLDLAWQLMLQNHAHDSIGGCAMDRVHEDVMNRYARLDDISHEAARMMLARVVPHINTDKAPRNSTLLLLFNTLPHPRKGEVLSATVDLPREIEAKGVEVTDLHGKPVAVQITGEELTRPTVQKPNDIPSPYFAKRFHVHVDASDLPGMGYKLLVVKPVTDAPPAAGVPRSPAARFQGLENEHIKLVIKSNGTYDLTDKNTGRTYQGLGYFEDAGEIGDPWLRIAPERDVTFTTLDTRAAIRIDTPGGGGRAGGGALVARAQIDITFNLPPGVTPDRKARSRKRVPLQIRTILTLKKNARRVEAITTFNNSVRDHRLRLVFPTGLSGATHSHAHMPFDVVGREIAVPKVEGWIEPPTGLQPNLWFVDVSDGRHGLAVLDEGITQYEVSQDDQPPGGRAIAFTLTRSFQMRNSFQNIDYPDQPGSQSPGPQTYRYAIYPHAGDYDRGGVMAELLAWNTPPIIAQIGTVEGGHLPPQASFISIEPVGPLVFSGIKPAADGKGDTILRFWNSTGRTIVGKVKTLARIQKAQYVRLDETHPTPAKVQKNNTIPLRVGPKKVVTLRLKLARLK